MEGRSRERKVWMYSDRGWKSERKKKEESSEASKEVIEVT